MESLFTPKESAICLFLSCLIPFSVKSLLFLLPTNLRVLRETRWAASSLRNTRQMWRGISGETDGCNKIHNFYLLFFDLFIEYSSCFCFWISSFFFIASCKKIRQMIQKRFINTFIHVELIPSDNSLFFPLTWGLYNPLSPTIQKQTLQTDLRTFPLRLVERIW